MGICVDLDRIDGLVERAMASPPLQRKALLDESLRLYIHASQDPSTPRELLNIHFWKWVRTVGTSLVTEATLLKMWDPDKAHEIDEILQSCPHFDAIWA